jgi:hypothetical protein
MAYERNNRTTPSIRQCKVCIDAGKTPEEYTSHWVKDRSGTVVCPTLLNQKCLMCGNFGHTSSYCTQLQYGESTHATTSRQYSRPPPGAELFVANPKPIARPISSNKYALLAIIEQEQEEQEEQVVEQSKLFPPLEKKPDITRPTANNIASANNTALGTWASRINAPPPPPPTHQEQSFRQGSRKPTRPRAIAVSWADL